MASTQRLCVSLRLMPAVSCQSSCPRRPPPRPRPHLRPRHRLRHLQPRLPVPALGTAACAREWCDLSLCVCGAAAPRRIASHHACGIALVLVAVVVGLIVASFSNKPSENACSMCDSPRAAGRAPAPSPASAPPPRAAPPPPPPPPPAQQAVSTSAGGNAPSTADCDPAMRGWMTTFYAGSEAAVRDAAWEFLQWLRRNRAKRGAVVTGSGARHVMYLVRRFIFGDPGILGVAIRLAAEAALDTVSEVRCHGECWLVRPCAALAWPHSHPHTPRILPGAAYVCGLTGGPVQGRRAGGGHRSCSASGAGARRRARPRCSVRALCA